MPINILFQIGCFILATLYVLVLPVTKCVLETLSVITTNYIHCGVADLPPPYT